MWNITHHIQLANKTLHFTLHRQMWNITLYIPLVMLQFTLHWHDKIIKPGSLFGPQSSLSLSINCCVSLSVSRFVGRNPLADFPWLFVGRSDGGGGGGCWGGAGEDGSEEIEISVREILDGAAEADDEAMSGKLSYIGFAKSVGFGEASGLYSRSSVKGLSWKIRMPHENINRIIVSTLRLLIEHNTFSNMFSNLVIPHNSLWFGPWFVYCNVTEHIYKALNVSVEDVKDCLQLMYAKMTYPGPIPYTCLHGALLSPHLPSPISTLKRGTKA